MVSQTKGVQKELLRKGTERKAEKAVVGEEGRREHTLTGWDGGLEQGAI